MKRPSQFPTTLSVVLLLALTPARAAETLAETVRRLDAENKEMKKEIARLKSDHATPAEPKTKKGKAAETTAAADADSQAKAALESLQDASFSFGVPDSPAAAVLGLAPEKIIHATTPKQLIMATINGLDDKGHFQTGFAVDFAPAQWIPQTEIVKRYESDRQARKGLFGGDPWLYGQTLLNRTQVSFASIRGTESEDRSSKLALGLNITLMDANDRVVGGEPLNVQANDEKGSIRPWTSALNRDFVDRGPFEDQGMGKMMNLMYRHASWSVGGAATWLAEDAHSSDYQYAGASAWSTFTFSMGRPEKEKSPFQGLLHVRYDNAQQVPGMDAVNPPKLGADPVTGTPIPAAAFVDQDSLMTIGGFRLGRADFNATASLAYVKRWQRSGGSGEEDSLIYAVSAEKRIGNGPMWLTLSAGEESGGTRDGNMIILGGVRLGFDAQSFGAKDKSGL